MLSPSRLCMLFILTHLMLFTVSVLAVLKDSIHTLAASRIAWHSSSLNRRRARLLHEYSYWKGMQLLDVTVSIGFASMDMVTEKIDTENIYDIIKIFTRQADGWLYQAKQTGRNRTSQILL